MLATSDQSYIDGTGTVTGLTTSTTGFSGGPYVYNIGGVGWQSSSKAWGDGWGTLRITGTMAAGQLTAKVVFDGDANHCFTLNGTGVEDRLDTVCGGTGGGGFTGGGGDGLGFGGTDSFPSDGTDSFPSDGGGFTSGGTGSFTSGGGTDPGRSHPLSGDGTCTGYEAHETFTLSGNGDAESTLHADGTYANGSFSLDSYSLHSDGVATLTWEDDGTRTASGDSLAFTLDAQDTASFLHDETGHDTNGAFGFDSYKSNETSSDSLVYDEQGNSVGGPGACTYDRDAASSHSSTLDKSGTGSSGTYAANQNGTENYTYQALCGPVDKQNDGGSNTPNDKQNGTSALPQDTVEGLKDFGRAFGNLVLLQRHWFGGVFTTECEQAEEDLNTMPDGSRLIYLDPDCPWSLPFIIKKGDLEDFRLEFKNLPEDSPYRRWGLDAYIRDALKGLVKSRKADWMRRQMGLFELEALGPWAMNAVEDDYRARQARQPKEPAWWNKDPKQKVLDLGRGFGGQALDTAEGLFHMAFDLPGTLEGLGNAIWNFPEVAGRAIVSMEKALDENPHEFVGRAAFDYLAALLPLSQASKARQLAAGARNALRGAGLARPVLNSFDDIVKNPAALYGKSADDVAAILGEGWTKGHYGVTGTGWKFTKGDRVVFYHEGGRHVGPYYGFSSGKTGKVKIVGEDYRPLPGDKAKIIRAPRWWF